LAAGPSAEDVDVNAWRMRGVVRASFGLAGVIPRSRERTQVAASFMAPLDARDLA
jgi:hypothetical protein